MDAPQIERQLLALIPEALRDTPQAIELVGRFALSCHVLNAATTAIVARFGLRSAEQLVIAAAEYRDALAAIAAWGEQIRQATDQAQSATVQ